MDSHLDPDIQTAVDALAVPDLSIQSLRQFAIDLKNGLGSVRIPDPGLEINPTPLSPLSAEPTMTEVAQFCKEARECLIYWKLGRELE